MRAQVDRSNEMMARQLQSVDTIPRRIFLIDLTPADYAEAEKERRIYLRRARKQTELRQLKLKRDRLRRNIQKMLDAGCEVRVVFDKDELYKGFREKVDFDYWDSELAIYDDFRVDVFGGGKTGVINRVRTYTRLMQDFPQYLSESTKYFDALWRAGEEIETFLGRLEAAERAAEQRIDYQPNWLARYEFRLNERDESLKQLELDRVKTTVEKHCLEIDSYLDIGTCTARYPIQLSKVLASAVEIIGVDADADCVQFARTNVLEQGESPDRIRIEHEDFTAKDLTISCLERQFDLITCLDMLEIYSDSDRQLLAAWTPKRKELSERLLKLGFSAKPSSIDPALRLDFWVCRKGLGWRISSPPPINSDGTD